MNQESLTAGAKPSFPSSFWTANGTELFERAAYYAMASFVVIYLGQLGFGAYWPSTLNSVLWFLVYFLPILSGTLADQYGFKKSLLIAFVLLAVAYFFMGFPVWFGGARLAVASSAEVTAGWRTALPIVAALVMIGIGGSIVKPCIAGTVQKTAGARKTLGFAIFYMIINMGSLLGRGLAFYFRRRFDLTAIFGVSMAMAAVAFMVVLLVYRDPDVEMGNTEKKPVKTFGEIFSGMFKVLGNGRFAMFLVVSSGFYFIYNQVYNLLPLYVKRTVELTPAMDIYTMANPFVIVAFQLLITWTFGKLPPIKSIVVGTVIIGFAMLINLAPLYMNGGVGLRMWDLLPLGSLFIVLTVALIAFGELFASARLYEYIGSLAPKGQEGLFLGYANIPMAVGSLVGGPAGAYLFNAIMCRGAVKLPSGLLKLDPKAATLGWVILTVIGLASAASMFAYNEWLKRKENLISD
jgi:dipeptide/tripeptide permease